MTSTQQRVISDYMDEAWFHWVKVREAVGEQDDEAAGLRLMDMHACVTSALKELRDHALAETR
jgi:hypothetical protein